jgi:medium-chain acyl-[acyl-carrier-protein] hydrolase
MEQNGVWQENFKVYAYMTDKQHQLTLFSLANCLQEVAGNHADSHDLGWAGMQAKNMFWVLNRLKISSLRQVTGGEQISVRTWLSEIRPFSHRHFEVLDVNGSVVAIAYAIWIPIDAESRKPKRVEFGNVPLLKKEDGWIEPEKLRELEANWRRCADRPIYYSDLDRLGHVNNAKYISWICDDFKKDYPKFDCKCFTINYLGELFGNERIEIFYVLREQTLEYMLKTKKSGKLVCRAKIVF